MKEESLTAALMREFLLGRVNDGERERIENLFLTDPQTKETVLAIEEDLIEDYLEDALNSEDKERFLTLYAQTEERRRELRITKSIKEWAVAQAREQQTAAATVFSWSRVWKRLRLKPVLVLPIAVMIVIAIALSFVWRNRQIERRNHLAVERQLVQLNSPESLRETPQNMTSFELRPVAVRSAEQQTELNLHAEISIVELRLPWIQKEHYSTYKAEIRRVGGDELFTIRDLQTYGDAAYAIRLRLPGNMLRRGSYLVQLSGVKNDGVPGPAEEYSFSVRK